MAAVFSPTPGMPGRLSLGSPRSAAKSGYCAGESPYFASTSSGVNLVRSLTPLRGYSTVTLVVDQLQRVAVAGADQRGHVVGDGPRGDRRDDVVGLVALDLQRRDVQRLEHLADERELTGEVRGRLAAARLVLGVGLAAERVPRDVEGDGDVRRLLVAQAG